MKSFIIIYRVYKKFTLTENKFLFSGSAYIQTSTRDVAKNTFISSFDKKLQIEIDQIKIL